MRRIKKPIDFLMGGRKLPNWVLIGTFTATGVGTGVTLGASGLAYSSGWAGSVYPIGIGLGTIIIGLIFSKMRRYNFMTLSEEISCYYGGNKIIFNFSNVWLFFSQIFWLAVQIMGGGFILSVVTGLPIKLSMVIAGALIAITSIPGGLLTVVYTDVLQGLILISGFIILTAVSLQNVGGFIGLRMSVPTEYFSFLGTKAIGWKSVISIMLALTIAIIADPARRLIMYSANTERGAKGSLITAGTIEIIFSIAVGIAGMYAYSLNPNIPAQDQAFPWLIKNVLPTWIAAIIIVSITAAVFSSGDSNAAAAGTYFMRHIYSMITGKYPKRPLFIVRWILVFLFLFSTLLALYAGTIIDFVVNFLSLTMSGIAVIIILGRFWKRSTWQGGVSGLITTFIVSLIVMFVPAITEFWVRPIIPATLAGIFVQIIVSLITPPKKLSFEEVVIKMTKEREGIDEHLNKYK
jgi:SSS family solute:Na+ symporter